MGEDIQCFQIFSFLSINDLSIYLHTYLIFLSRKDQRLNWVIACKDGSLYYTSHGYNIVHAVYTMVTKFIEFLLPFRTTCKKNSLTLKQFIKLVTIFYLLYFTGKEAEAQSSQYTCPRVQRLITRSKWDLKLGGMTPWCGLFMLR